MPNGGELSSYITSSEFKIKFEKYCEGENIDFKEYNISRIYDVLNVGGLYKSLKCLCTKDGDTYNEKEFSYIPLTASKIFDKSAVKRNSEYLNRLKRFEYLDKSDSRIFTYKINENGLNFYNNELCNAISFLEKEYSYRID